MITCADVFELAFRKRHGYPPPPQMFENAAKKNPRLLRTDLSKSEVIALTAGTLQALQDQLKGKA